MDYSASVRIPDPCEFVAQVCQNTSPVGAPLRAIDPSAVALEKSQFCPGCAFPDLRIVARDYSKSCPVSSPFGKSFVFMEPHCRNRIPAVRVPDAGIRPVGCEYACSIIAPDGVAAA